ncbi:uncharacterized protein SCHCODRAFT_02291471 [Schizophyllum commune H4-8]|uniref:uncharacterized protein n=1 Tax=Schizophyllum commune (strain H4-8 / FGSC 9210) TaxID=578458 RepID=UPI00215E98D8|nr:uncharacterized protein SCHCODRAFT_02291471 [Schizophyllum commune H4-8]KAI5892418.1 hypothetical protein SCHCODRAFT_02291471 [Schizophyllum commune H4-8]
MLSISCCLLVFTGTGRSRTSVVIRPRLPKTKGIHQKKMRCCDRATKSHDSSNATMVTACDFMAIILASQRRVARLTLVVDC